MELSKQETRMLEGDCGEVIRQSMELLMSIGECFDSRRFIPVRSAHLIPCLVGVGEAGALYIREQAEKGARCVVFTDTNPRNVEPELWDDLGLPEEFARQEQGIVDAYASMGVSLSNTCTPYQTGDCPGLHEHVAWTESSAVVFLNSVLGARTNREGGPTALASALTGRTPEYGYHLPENRLGNLRVLVTAEIRGSHDFGTLGYFTGRIAGDGVPVFVGLPKTSSRDELKTLGSGVACSGGVAMFHGVGITPEAQSEEEAFGRRRSSEINVVEFDQRALIETEQMLSRADKREVDLVVLGCPHASKEELTTISRLLYKRRLKGATPLWVVTSRAVKELARRAGLIEVIESSGARVVFDICPIYPAQLAFGPGTIATNSAKLCFYISQGDRGLLPHYGSTERCVQAALTGVWS